MATKVYENLSEICTNLDMYITRFCLPIRKSCTQTCTELIVTDLSGLWNCNLCQTEEPFYVPYDSGDLIQIQTRFTDYYNADPENPTVMYAGWMLASICAEDGSVLSSDINAFSSRRMAGWDGSSYQITELNTALVDTFTGGACWNLKIESYDSGAELRDTYYTQHFRPNNGCKTFVKLKGEYSKYDCCGNYYGLPTGGYVSVPASSPFQYDNTFKADAQFFESDASLTKTVFSSSKRTNATVTCLFTFQPNSFIPIYFRDMIFKQVLGAERFYINDVEYTYDDGTSTTQGRKGTMRLPIYQVASVCENDYLC